MLDSAINEVRKNSIFKDNVDWNTLIPTIYQSVDLSAVDSIRMIMPAIKKLYSEIGDNHGVFIYGSTPTKGYDGTVSRIDSNLYRYAFDEKYAFRTKLINGKYGYLAVPSPQIPSNYFDDKEMAINRMSEMAQQIQDSLYRFLAQDLDGIIIDLRLSMGGNTPILLSGLAPLIGEGVILSIAKSDGSTTPFSHQDGKLYEGEVLLSQTNSKMFSSNTSIVVLIGPLTSSAAEQTALSFKVKENVKFIGEQTAGYTTMTSLIHFRDDLIFTYASGHVKDRNNNIYKDSVDPDIAIVGGDNFESLESDRKIISSMKWFETLAR